MCWCPRPGCDVIVRVTRVIETEEASSISHSNSGSVASRLEESRAGAEDIKKAEDAKAIDRTTVDMHCKCGEYFCASCLVSAHQPLSCVKVIGLHYRFSHSLV